MRVKIIKNAPSTFTLGKVYKVEEKFHNSFLIRNNNGHLQSVKKEYCEEVSALNTLKNSFKRRLSNGY